MIPAIRANRPDIEISSHLNRFLDNPDEAGQPRGWLVVSALIMNIVLLCLILSPNHQNLFDYLIIGGILVSASSILGPWVIPVAKNARERFIECTLHCSLILVATIQGRFLSSTEHIALELIIRTGLVMYIAALVAFITTKKLSMRKQFFIILLFSIPLAMYHYDRAQMWPATDISDLIPPENFSSPLWGRTGTYLTSTEPDYLIHVPTMEREPIEKHGYENRAIWLDRRFFIRKTWDTDKDDQLWVYNHQQNRDVRISASQEFSVSFRAPVCPKGIHLAWIDHKEDREEQKLRFWNLETMQEDLPAHALPAEIDWGRYSATWIGDKEIVTHGKSRSQDDEKETQRSIHIMLLRLDKEESKLYSTSRKYKRWYPCPNRRYAFATRREDSERRLVYFVDMQTDEELAIEDRLYRFISPALPLPMAEVAYWIGEHKGLSFLIRFEYETKQETALCSVSHNMALVGISHDESLALLAAAEDRGFPMPVYEILHVASGRTHRMILPGFMSVANSVYSVIYGPAGSPFSPDGRKLILQSVFIGGSKLLLYTIPSNWPEE